MLWVFPSWVVQVYLWTFRYRNIMLSSTRFFDVAKFTILTPFSLLSWCRLSFPIIGLKIFSLPTFALKSPNTIFMWYLGKWSKNLFYFLTKSVFRIITFLLSCCMHIQSNITPVTSQNYIWHPIANKLYCLNCWYYSVVYKYLVPNWWFSFLFPLKNHNPLLVPSPFVAHLTYCTPTKSNLYFANALASVKREPDLYRLLTFQVPNLMSLFHCFSCTKVSVQLRGFLCERFVIYVFTVKSC